MMKTRKRFDVAVGNKASPPGSQAHEILNPRRHAAARSICR